MVVELQIADPRLASAISLFEWQSHAFDIEFQSSGIHGVRDCFIQPFKMIRFTGGAREHDAH